MVVEFVGVMGAGKTTLHRRAVEKAEALGCPVWTTGAVGTLSGLRSRRLRPSPSALVALRRYAFRIWASWRSRHLVVLAVRHLGSSGRNLSDRVKGLRWFLTDLGNHWTARLRIPSRHVVLFDEGLAQRAVNLFIHGCGAVDLSGVRRYARTIPLPDVLVHVVVDPETARRRAGARGANLSSRFNGLSDDELRGVFNDASRALDALVAEVRYTKRHAVTVLTIDATELNSASQAFDAQFDRLLTGQDTATISTNASANRLMAPAS